MDTCAYIPHIHTNIYDHIEHDCKTSACQNNSAFSQMKIGFSYDTIFHIILPLFLSIYKILL